MIKTHCNSEKRRPGENKSDQSGLYPIDYDRQESSLPS